MPSGIQITRRITQVISNWFSWNEMPSGEVVCLAARYTPEEQEQFLADFCSRVWFSYRKAFAPIVTDQEGTTIESDQGWGCMVRVTQMLLAEGAVRARLGRDWRRSEADMAEGSPYLDICQRFFDTPEAPFSLHNFVARGTAAGRKAATWFGPTSCAQVAEALVNELRPDGLRAVCDVDGVLYRKPVLDALAQEGTQGVIVLLCRKLGVDSFQVARYKAPIQACFSSRFFLGLSGGGPTTSAYWFVAADDSRLYYLDPHAEVRPALVSLEEAKALHVQRPLHLNWEALNPSMCLPFLVKSAEELTELADWLVATDPEAFEVMDEPKNFAESAEAFLEEDEFLVLGDGEAA